MGLFALIVWKLYLTSWRDLIRGTCDGRLFSTTQRVLQGCEIMAWGDRKINIWEFRSELWNKNKKRLARVFVTERLFVF